MDAKRLLVPSLSILVLLVACSQPPGGGGPADDEVLIPPTTEVLDSEDRVALLGVDGEGTSRFSASSGIGGDLTGTVGIGSVDVLDLHYDKEPFDACVTFANDGNEPPNVFVQSPVAGSQIFVGDDVALRAFAADPDGHDVACTWVSSQSGDPFPIDGCESTVSFTTPGIRTLTVTGTDPAGTSDDGSVLVDVQEAPEILVTTVTPTEGHNFFPDDETTTLEGAASGGEAPYAYAWSIAYPTDERRWRFHLRTR